MIEKGNIGVLVAAAADGRTLADVGAASGLSISSVQRRLREPAVASAVALARRDLQRQAVGRLASLRSEALDGLAALVQDEDRPVRLRAIDLALRHGLSYEVAYEREQRLITSLAPAPGLDALEALADVTAEDGWAIELALPELTEGVGEDE